MTWRDVLKDAFGALNALKAPFSAANALKASFSTRALALAGVSVLLVATGCSGGVYDMSLPGGADLGDRPYSVQVQFGDVADLVPQAAVKVNDVPVGKVTAIELGKDNHTVTVSVTVNRSAVLPGNATARLRQSSLLGEKYVDLSPPVGQAAQGQLAEGATIPVSRTTKTAEVEQVLGAVSLLLNGGGLEQAQTITKELNQAMSGNETRIRSLLSNVTTLASTLDKQRESITKAVDGVAQLSATIAKQRGDVANALERLTPGVQVLNQQREQFVGLLRAVDKLSGVAVDTVNRSKDDMVADLRALAPTLRQLAAAGDSLPKSLELLLTFPFSDAGLAVIKGDYANAEIVADFKLDSLLNNFGRSAQPIIPLPGNTAGPDLPGHAAPPALPLPGDAAPAAPPVQKGLGGLLGAILGGG
ncbi:MCE family protein [Amycolatopsis sp. NPDC059027]|uniref:MCE family protein n=1 Tax=Amycolatopsis sp. NPDC059027 TaxID=3346709 RepID=UPI00366BEB88